MGVVGWMCGMKLQDGVPGGGVERGLRLRDIVLVLQQDRLQWCGHVLRKEDNDWVWRCMDYGVESAGAGPRGIQRKLGERLWKKTNRRIH